MNIKFLPRGGHGLQRRRAPASHALAMDPDTKGKEGARGSRARAGAVEEMPPLLAVASDLLLNKHISGLRVKYIGLQQSGRPLGDQLLILCKLLTYFATMIWMRELCGARPFSEMSKNSMYGQLERPASRELRSIPHPTPWEGTLVLVQWAPTGFQ